MSLICTGTIGIDTVSTPHGQRERVLGGSCTYFAAAASFYGPVRIVAAAGDDWPAEHRAALARFRNIDTAGLEVRVGSRTFAWGGKYHRNMNSRDTLFTELGVLAEKPPAIPPRFRDSRYVFLANSHPAVQLGMLGSLPERRLVVADTMDLWINTAREPLGTLLASVDGLVLNYDEAELLTGKSNTAAAARHVLELMSGGAPAPADAPGRPGRLAPGKPGPGKFVVVKKGEHGCIIVTRDGIAALPAYPTEEVIDPTGAGDTFAGGMMGFLAASLDEAPGGAGRPIDFEALRRALVHGTVMASFTIESFSLDRLSTLTRGEIDERYARYAAMVRV